MFGQSISPPPALFLSPPPLRLARDARQFPCHFVAQFVAVNGLEKVLREWHFGGARKAVLEEFVAIRDKQKPDSFKGRRVLGRGTKDRGQFITRHIRQIGAEQNEVRVEIPQKHHRGLRVGRKFYRMTQIFQKTHEGVRGFVIAFHDQNADGSGRSGGEHRSRRNGWHRNSLRVGRACGQRKFGFGDSARDGAITPAFFGLIQITVGAFKQRRDHRAHAQRGLAVG